MFNPLNARIVLNNIVGNGVIRPSLAGRVEDAIVHLDLRFTLEDLNSKSFRGVPSDVAMHEPDLH